MRKIPLINATIIAANEKTRQAEAALGNAAADAREAKAKAEEAEKIASTVQKVPGGETITQGGDLHRGRDCYTGGETI